jgi:hypothetical protein
VIQVLTSLPLWFVNGALYIVYWIVGNLFSVYSCGVALLIAFGIDPHIQSRAVDRPRRYGRGIVSTGAPSATYLTLVTALIWTGVSITSKFPIPLIGAVLWTLAITAILVVTEERYNMLWWAKIGILVYAVLVVGLQAGLYALQITDPVAWAGMIGSSGDAQDVIANTRGNIATIGILFEFAIYPLSYAGLLFNRVLRNPKPFFSAWTEFGDVIRHIRTRQG